VAARHKAASPAHYEAEQFRAQLIRRSFDSAIIPAPAPTLLVSSAGFDASPSTPILIRVNSRKIGGQIPSLAMNRRIVEKYQNQAANALISQESSGELRIWLIRQN